MCQLSFIHTKDNNLNKLLFLLMGSFGSTVHNDGWGMVNSKGDSWKCDIPMWGTWNAGERVQDLFQEEYSPLMGHIRLASASVPVNVENAHPFRSENKKILFMHNGTLKPNDEKDFVLDFEVEEIDDKTKDVKKKKIKISDSIIFFSKFQEIFTGDKTFENALRETMSLFYGKFAFMFYNIDIKQFYVVRGKTADLFITYLLESDLENSKIIGYVINTSDNILNISTNLASNIYQMYHGKELFWSKAALIPAESIYVAEDFDIKNLGEIKENFTPISAYSGNIYPRTVMGTNFWSNEDESYVWNDVDEKVEKKTVESKRADEIRHFMEEYSLTFRDIQYLLLFGYEISTLESEDYMIKHFCDIVIPRFRSLVPKDVRKAIKKLLNGSSISSLHYTEKGLNLEYPWMLNDENTIKNLVKYLEDQEKENK